LRRPKKEFEERVLDIAVGLDHFNYVARRWKLQALGVLVTLRVDNGTKVPDVSISINGQRVTLDRSGVLTT